MTRHVTSLIVSCAAFVVAPLAAWAAPITVPTDLNPGDQYRLAFVTSTTRNAASTDIADYNTFVSDVANGVTELADLGTTWTAIGSTSTVDARDNTGTNPSSTGVPIYRLDDTRIANDNADLWDSSLLAPPVTIEDGAPGGTIVVWTGTGPTGTGILDHQLGESDVRVGVNTYTTFRWVSRDALTQENNNHLYAISAVLTVVPEPGTISLACIGAAALAGCMLRRRVHSRRRSRRNWRKR